MRKVMRLHHTALHYLCFLEGNLSLQSESKSLGDVVSAEHLKL